MRYNRPVTIPIVAGLQAFDQSIVPYEFNSDGVADTEFNYISGTLRNDEGPSMENWIIWMDNMQHAYATQRPAIKRVLNIGDALTDDDYATEVLADTPLYYYRMSSPATESGVSLEPNLGSIGVGTATYNATTTLPTQVPGLINGDFDAAKSFGTDNTARLTLSSTVETSTDDSQEARTFEMIITPTATDVGTGNAYILDRVAVGSLGIYVNGTGKVVYDLDSGTTTHVGTTTLVAGDSYHIAVTHDGGAGAQNVRLYVSPVADSTVTEDVTVLSTAVRDGNTTATQIGTEVSITDGFEGVIDELAIYPSSLSTTRLNAHLTRIQGSTFGQGTGTGRGIYRDSAGLEYMVVGSQITSLATTKPGGVPVEVASTPTTVGKIPDGDSKVYMDQTGARKVAVVVPGYGLLEYTDNTTSSNIEDFTGFLPEGVTVGKGTVFLNGRLYIIDESTGRIYNSAEGDLLSWNENDFKVAERDFDSAQMIIRHHDHLAVFGTRTIEFFYDNGNPTASPLERRQDYFYNIGIIGDATKIEDTVYFIGVSEGSDFGIYKLENFQVAKISDELVNTKIEAMVAGANPLVLAGFSVSGRPLLSITQINDVTGIGMNPDAYELKQNKLYDIKYGAMYDWSSTNTDLDPVIIDTAISGSLLTLQGTAIQFQPILSTTVEDDNTTGSDTDGIPATPIAVSATITSPNLTFGNSHRKMWRQLDIEGTHGKKQNGADPVTFTFDWTDDFYDTFSTARTVDFDSNRFVQKALGSSRQRAFRIITTSKVRLFLQNWVIRYTEAKH
jgi:hypothetical protein